MQQLCRTKGIIQATKHLILIMAKPQKTTKLQKSKTIRVNIDTNQEFSLPGPSNQDFSLPGPSDQKPSLSEPSDKKLSVPQLSNLELSQPSQTGHTANRKSSKIVSLKEEIKFEIRNLLENYLTDNPVTTHCVHCISFNHLCKDCKKIVYIDEASRIFWNITRMKWENPILTHTSIVRDLIQQSMERKTQNNFCTESKFRFHIRTSCWTCIWSEKALNMF